MHICGTVEAMVGGSGDYHFTTTFTQPYHQKRGFYECFSWHLH